MSNAELISNLQHYYRNPRRGDVESIMESVKALGQFRPVVVNRGTLTGRLNEILAGNHVIIAMRNLGHESAEVDWVDVDEETAARIVLIDNRSADSSTYDQAVLSDLIASLAVYDGTGYTSPDEAKTAKAKAGVVHEKPEQVKPSGGQGHDQYSEYENYKASNTRHLFLGWPVEDYERVQKDLGQLRKAWGLATNGDVVRRLIGL